MLAMIKTIQTYCYNIPGVITAFVTKIEATTKDCFYQLFFIVGVVAQGQVDQGSATARSVINSTYNNY